ncbi:FxsA family protein [Ferrimonas sediminicola]|uniref:FxsA family protein n=1 Tax=Ferrimonas sediminicola TaxID=2569538 RepID=A0A4U1BMJ6_9GAMM|nr:FxsA family protein [Ferrimonas sediminicola]TKB51348.1 FxsA family protein [Ferrimonas sediminicola]
MVFYLFLLFAVMPIIEIAVLVQVGTTLGAWPTIALVLLTAALGASLVRSQGLSTMMEVRNRMARGEMPGTQIMEAMLLAVAGVLLVTPGFVTDLFGLLILTPFTRRKLATWLMSRAQIHIATQQQGFGFHGQFHQHDDRQAHFGQPRPFDRQDNQGRGGNSTIEGEYERKDD